MDPLVRYSGFFFLTLLAAATAILWLRDRIRTGNDGPRRRHSTRRALLFFLCVSPPWVVMAIGEVAGSLHEPSDFINFQNGAFAYAFVASVCFVWLALFYWLRTRGGRGGARPSPAP